MSFSFHTAYDFCSLSLSLFLCLSSSAHCRAGLMFREHVFKLFLVKYNLVCIVCTFLQIHHHHFSPVPHRSVYYTKYSLPSIWWHNFMNQPKEEKKNLLIKKLFYAVLSSSGLIRLFGFVSWIHVYILPYCLSVIILLLFCPYNYYYLWMHPYFAFASF